MIRVFINMLCVIRVAGVTYHRDRKPKGASLITARDNLNPNVSASLIIRDRDNLTP
jgi:hypothetical protein